MKFYRYRQNLLVSFYWYLLQYLQKVFTGTV